MPVFAEDPAQLPISRLKSDLIAHNVALPPAKSRKEVYVELHLRHVYQRHAAEFSSDEEEQDEAEQEEEEEPEAGGMPDPSGLTDDDLKAALRLHGVKAGPIVASTRVLYEKKLSNLLQSDKLDKLNGTEKEVLYSDSEEEEKEEEEEEEEQQQQEVEEEEEDGDSGCERAKQDTVKHSEQDQQGNGQNGGYIYPQCFLPPSRLAPSGSQSVNCSTFTSQTFSITQMVEEMECQRSLSTSVDGELSGSNERERRSRPTRLDTPVADKNTKKNRSFYQTPEASFHKWKKKLPQEPVKDAFKDLLPDTKTTPTGIYATCRRPIKGAAGRPVQSTYPDTPVSPTTLERREVERRIVPIQIQILVFFIVVFFMCLIYSCV